MAIEDRNLEIGTRLVANYKKQTYVCRVESSEEGEGVVFVLEDGKRFKSPSAAGSAVMGGKAVNGWRFWSLAGEAEPAPEAAATKPAKAKAPKAKAPKATKLLYKVPNQKGTPEGKQKWFCTACMKGFLVDDGRTPDACPEGHRSDDPRFAGIIGQQAGTEKEQAIE